MFKSYYPLAAVLLCFVFATAQVVPNSEIGRITVQVPLLSNGKPVILTSQDKEEVASVQEIKPGKVHVVQEVVVPPTVKEENRVRTARSIRNAGEVNNPGIPNHGIPNPGIPNHGIPNPGIPNHGIPNRGIPNDGIPNPGIPNHGIPNPGIPNHGIPNRGIPNDGIPNPGIPNHGIPNPGIPNHGIPNRGIPNDGIPNPGIPNHGIPNPGIPNHGIPNRGIPNDGIPNPGIPNHGIPNPGIPNHGIPNRGIPNDGIPNPGIPNHGIPNPGIPNHGVPKVRKARSIRNSGEVSNPGIPNHGIPNPGIPNHGIPNPGTPNHGIPNPGIPNHGTPNPGVASASELMPVVVMPPGRTTSIPAFTSTPMPKKVPTRNCFHLLMGAMTTMSPTDMMTTAPPSMENCEQLCTKLEFVPICATNGVCVHEFANQCVMDTFNCKNRDSTFRAVEEDVCRLGVCMRRCKEEDLKP
ncbi:RNA-binding protein 12 [Drosophila ficusphila]|uniref:RNA-binding protein 12 n=1 Tax=Drosophila ficusphila TaxID=30025 RepID=UPI001C89C8FD|nr:RNA-binding protein 12 [Drosophila ficusphila]